MKLLLTVAVIALSLATGFTCSRSNPPPAEPTTTTTPETAPNQEQMAAPPGDAPADSAAPTEAAPAPEKH